MCVAFSIYINTYSCIHKLYVFTREQVNLSCEYQHFFYWIVHEIKSLFCIYNFFNVTITSHRYVKIKQIMKGLHRKDVVFYIQFNVFVGSFVIILKLSRLKKRFLGFVLFLWNIFFSVLCQFMHSIRLN